MVCRRRGRSKSGRLDLGEVLWRLGKGIQDRGEPDVRWKGPLAGRHAEDGKSKVEVGERDHGKSLGRQAGRSKLQPYLPRTFHLSWLRAVLTGPLFPKKRFRTGSSASVECRVLGRG